MTAPRALFTETQVAARVEGLAAAIARDLPHDTVVVGILVAAFVFTADLVRGLGRHGMRPRVDFVRLASYASARTPHREPTLVGPVPEHLGDRHVLLVDTVLDTGHTLHRAVDIVRAERPAAIATCILVDKPARRQVAIAPDYVGFAAEGFLVGYGLDDGQGGRWRADIVVATDD